jgi:hypothetical protein
MALTPGQKRVERLLHPAVRKARRRRRKLAAVPKPPKGATGKEKRVRPRITIDELNKGGIEALKKKGITPQKVQSDDPRSGFEVVLDWIDLPRNLVAQAVGSIAGVDKSKIRAKGTFGLKRINMSDVLDKVGVKQGLGRSIAGFLGDVAIDPLTYLGSGATIGKSIAKHLPRAKPAFVKAMKGAAKGVSKGLDPDFVRGIGGPDRLRELQKLAAAPGKGGAKRLFAKSGGFLPRALLRASKMTGPVGSARFLQGEAARAALQKGLFKGRQALGIPFTGIAGPTIPGKLSKGFKALGDVEAFKKLADASKIPREVLGIVNQIKNLERTRQAAKVAGNTDEVRNLNQAIAKLRKGAKGLATNLDPKGREVGKFLQPGEKFSTTRLQSLAKGEKRLLRQGGEAPELLRIEQEALRGTSPTSEWGKSAARIFGQKASPDRARAQNLAYAQRQGGTDARLRYLNKVQGPTDELSLKISTDFGVEPKVARRMLHGYVEYDDAARGGLRLAPGDPLLGKVKIAERQALDKIPGVAEYRRTNLAQRQAWAEAKRAKGLGAKQAAGAKVEPELLNRFAAPGARKALAKQSTGAGKQTSAVLAGHKLQPENAVRSKAVVMFTKESPEGFPVLARSNATVDSIAQQGGAIRASVVDASKSPVTLDGKFMSQVPMTVADIKAAEKQGLEVIITRYDPSTELVNDMLTKDKGLRTILGYDEAQDITEFFDFDSASTMARQAGQHNDSMVAAGVRDFGKGTGVEVDALTIGSPQYRHMKIPEPLAANHPLVQIIGPGVYDVQNSGIKTALEGGRSMAFPAPVADSMNRLAKLYEGGEEMNKFLRATDITLGWFKRWALFHPAYVTRNVWDNNFGIVMAGGNVGKSAKFGVGGGLSKGASWRIRNAVVDDTIDALRQSGKRVQLGGKKMLEADVAQFAKDHAMLQAGRTAADIAPFARDAGRAVTNLGKATQKGKGFFNGIRTWNSKIEEYMRLGAFMSFVDDGQPFRQALMNTTLAMPDLGNVTKFEKDVMVRIFPWYRWAKNNGARQFFHFIPQKPAYIAGVRKLQNLVQGMAPTVPDNLRPEWMREAQAAQISGDEESGSAFLLRNWFPFEEFQALTAGLAEPAEAARYIAGSTRPGVKLPFELATGSDIFRQRRTEPFTMAETLGQAPSAFVGGSGTPLDNFLAIRPLREFRRVGEQPDLLGKGLRTFIGGAVQPLSAERGRMEIDLKTRNALQKLRQKINRAQENNDQVEAQSLMAQFLKLQIRRQRTGLKIPKATQEALANVPRR